MAEQRTETDDSEDRQEDLCNGGVTIAEFNTEEDCNFAVYLLAENGIRSVVLIPDRRFDLRLPQVRVSLEDESAAIEVLARPIAASQRAEYDSEPDYEPFEPPCCPKCSSRDVVLERVESENIWKCDGCAEIWTELAR